MIDLNDWWYRISIKALIYNEKWQILLCKESDWRWELPGWWLDLWEKYDACLKRELMEEMWLKIVDINKNPKYFITVDDPKSKKRPWKANVCYEVKVKDLNFTPSDECIEIWFFDKESIKKIPVFVNVTEVFNEI